MSSKLDEALAEMDGETVEETPPPEPEAPPEAPPEDTTPAGPEDSETPAERDDRIAAYLDKYGGDTDKALAAAVEAQELIGRQGSELGELRRAVEDVAARIPEQEEPGLQIDQPMVDWFDEEIEANPYAAAEWARQNDPSGRLFQRALQNWTEIPGQQLFVTNYLTDLKVEQMRAEMVEQTAPLKTQAEQQLVAAAWDRASAEIPDLIQFGTQIMEEAKESPEILKGATTLEDKTKAIHKLYRLVKGGQATSVEAATAENAQTEAEAARNAKLDGKAASQTRAVVPETLSEDEKWAREHLDPHLARYSAPE